MVDHEATAAPSGQGVSGEVWQHVKRGTSYEVVGRAELQNGNVKGLREGVTLVVYRGSDGKLWAREEGEFTDGRFVRLAAPAPLCAPGEVERDAATTDAIRRLQFKADFQRGYGADWFSLDRADADLILAALSPQGLDAATVERNLEAQRQAIEACARLVGGHPMRMDDNVRMTLETAIRSLRPDEALATEPRGGKG